MEKIKKLKIALLGQQNMKSHRKTNSQEQDITGGLAQRKTTIDEDNLTRIQEEDITGI